MIPKNLFQFHHSYEKLGIVERVCVERWQLMNPDWDYHFVTNEEGDAVVRELLGERFGLYEKAHFGAKNDLRRVAMLHKHGGLYADTDLYPIAPLRRYIPMDKDRVLFAYTNRDLFLGGLLASKAGDPMTIEIINLSLDRMRERPAPPRESRETWMSWHFDVCGTHLSNDVYRNYIGSRTAIIRGGDSDGSTPDEDVKCYHYGTALWAPGGRPGRCVEEELSFLNWAKGMQIKLEAGLPPSVPC